MSKGVTSDSIWVYKSFNVKFEHREEIASSCCLRYMFEFSVNDIFTLQLVREMGGSGEMSDLAINDVAGQVVLVLLFYICLS
jgi:hypothetical protein